MILYRTARNHLGKPKILFCSYSILFIFCTTFFLSFLLLETDQKTAGTCFLKSVVSWSFKALCRLTSIVSAYSITFDGSFKSNFYCSGISRLHWRFACARLTQRLGDYASASVAPYAKEIPSSRGEQ